MASAEIAKKIANMHDGIIRAVEGSRDVGVEALRALSDKEHADGLRFPLETKDYRGEIVGAIK